MVIFSLPKAVCNKLVVKFILASAVMDTLDTFDWIKFVVKLTSIPKDIATVETLVCNWRPVTSTDWFIIPSDEKGASAKAVAPKNI